MSMPREISVEALKSWLEDPARPSPLLLDVRHPQETMWAALRGAILVPLPELPDALDELEAHRDRPIVCFCHHGVRSLAAVALLSEAGFDVTSLRGGLDAWAVRVDPSLPRY